MDTKVIHLSYVGEDISKVPKVSSSNHGLIGKEEQKKNKSKNQWSNATLTSNRLSLVNSGTSENRCFEMWYNFTCTALSASSISFLGLPWQNAIHSFAEMPGIKVPARAGSFWHLSDQPFFSLPSSGGYWQFLACPGLKLPPCNLWFSITWLSLCVFVFTRPSFYKDTSHMECGLALLPYDLILTNCICEYPFSK